jgi:uncharacterized membrane protein
VGGFWAASYLFGVLIVNIPPARVPFLNNQGSGEQGIGPLLFDATVNRLGAPGAWLSMLGLLTILLALLMQPAPSVEGEEPQDDLTATRAPHAAGDFAVLLGFFALILVLVPEFFYLRDFFGGRMNTIFKFYFQAWILWAIVAAFGSAVLLKSLPRSRMILIPLGAAVIAAGLCYPAVMLKARTGGFDPNRAMTLDGTAYLDRYYPDDMQAIRWLTQAPPGVVAEAVGGQYSSYGRVSALSGKPAVLGWPGHEDQWRGGREEMGTRDGDIPILYNTRSWLEARRIIDQYDIRYIFVGELERGAYHVNEALFDENLTRVYESGATRVYEVPESLINQGSLADLED